MNANSSSTVFCAAADQLAALRVIVEHVAPDRRPRDPAPDRRAPPSRRTPPAPCCSSRSPIASSAGGRRVDQFLGAVPRLDVRGAGRRMRRSRSAAPSLRARRRTRRRASRRCAAAAFSSSRSAASATSANASGRSRDADPPRRGTSRTARSTNTRGGFRMFSRAEAEQLRHMLQLGDVPAWRAPPPETTPSSSGCGRRRRSPTRKSSDCASRCAPSSRSSSQPSTTPCRMRRSTRSSAVSAAASTASSCARERAQPRDFRGDGAGGKVLERVVVGVQAVAGGDRWVASRELLEVVVHERGELRRWLRRRLRFG